MSVTTKAAVAELKHKPGRLAAVLLAIIIGSLFAVATTVLRHIDTGDLPNSLRWAGRRRIDHHATTKGPTAPAPTG